MGEHFGSERNKYGSIRRAIRRCHPKRLNKPICQGHCSEPQSRVQLFGKQTLTSLDKKDREWQVKLDEGHPVMYRVCLRVIFECVDYHLRLNHSQVVARIKRKENKGMLGEGQMNMGLLLNQREWYRMRQMAKSQMYPQPQRGRSVSGTL